MNQLLLEELKRFQLLSYYDNKTTYTENSKIISEQRFGGALKALEGERAAVKDLSSIMKDTKYAEELRKIGGEIKSVDGAALKTADDVINAIKNNKITPQELGRFNVASFKSSAKGSTVEAALAKDIASTESFAAKYGGKPSSEVKSELTAKGYTPEQAELLINTYKGTAKDVKTVASDSKTIAKDTKTVAGDTKTVAGDTKTVTKDTKTAAIDGKTAEKELDDISREIEASKGRADVMKKEAELNKQLKLEAQEAKKLAESGEALGKAVKDGKSGGVLKWLKESKFIQWTKKIIFNKYVLALAAIYGGYLLWKKFFGDNGITIEDDGTTTSTGSGDSGTGDSGTGTGGGTSPETQQWLNDPQAGDGETGDPNMSKYVACMKEPYKLWCSDPMGSPVIKKLQQCVGVKPTGFWGTKTEEAVKRKGIWGKTTLSFNEIKSGCLVGQTW
jgi:hypothetical protein